MSQMGTKYNQGRFFDDVEPISYLYKFWLQIEGQVIRTPEELDLFMKDRNLPYRAEIRKGWVSWEKLAALFVEVHEVHGGHLGNVSFKPSIIHENDPHLIMYFGNEKVASLFALMG